VIPKLQTDKYQVEVVSKSQVRFKSKAQADEKAQSRRRRDEQYILKRFATQLLSLKWGFGTTSCYHGKYLNTSVFGSGKNYISLASFMVVKTSIYSFWPW
jgi:hypothetical protein